MKVFSDTGLESISTLTGSLLIENDVWEISFVIISVRLGIQKLTIPHAGA